MLVFKQEPSIWPVQSYAEITLEKCICVGRTIVNTVPPSDKKNVCLAFSLVHISFSKNLVYPGYADF